ncbi:hypothetical protein BsWGS_06150 [Bradybaena similaris]
MLKKMMPVSKVTSLVCVLIMAVIAAGSHALHRSKHRPGSGQTKDETGQPAPCCLPYRFQAIVAMLPIFSDGKKAVTRLSRDWKNRIQVHDNVIFSSAGDEQIIRQTFLVYNRMLQYDYTPDGTCHTSALDYGMLEPCMPDNSSYLGQWYLGALNEKTVFNTWNFRRTNLNRNIEITIAVTADKCVPISEHITGQIGTNPVDSLVLFTNVTEQVADRFFDIPRACFGVQPM